MSDEMFLSGDSRSLHRGKRRYKRTDVCRPCILWPKDAPDMTFQGVVLDVTPYGVGIRMLDTLPPGTVIMFQLMRNEDFTEPLSPPTEGMIVRNNIVEEGFIDHGIQIRREQIRRAESSRPIRIERKLPRPVVRRGQSRMKTTDLIGISRWGRRR